MPNLGRRPSVEVLVWTNVVVPAAKQIEVIVELREIGHLPLVELLFEGTEETFDPAVLPGAARIGPLVADAQPLQSAAKFAGAKNGLVVGPDDLGFAIGANGFMQAGEQGSGGFVAQCVQAQQGAAAVIQNAEQRMKGPLCVGFAGEVQRR